MEHSRSSSRQYLSVLFWSAWASYKGFFAWLTPLAFVAEKVVTPLATLTFFTMIGIFATGPETAAFYVIGNSFLASTLNTVFAVSRSVEDERLAGTLSQILAASRRHSAPFFGRALIHALDGFVTIGVTLLWGMLIFGLEVPARALPAILSAGVVASISGTGFGLLLGALALVTLNSYFFGNFGLLLIALASGALVPLSRLPSGLRVIGLSLPVTRSILAARVALNGDPAASVPLLLADLGIYVAYAAASYLLFLALAARARRNGSVDFY